MPCSRIIERATLERLRVPVHASRRGACSSDRSRRSAHCGTSMNRRLITRCRCVSISASNARSNSSLPGLCFAPSCSWIFAGHLVHPELDDRHVRGRRLEIAAAARCATTRAAPAPAARSLRRKQDEHQVAPCARASARRPSRPRRAPPAHASLRLPGAAGRTDWRRAGDPSARGTSGAGRSSLRVFRERTGCASANASRLRAPIPDSRRCPWSSRLRPSAGARASLSRLRGQAREASCRSSEERAPSQSRVSARIS